VIRFTPPPDRPRTIEEKVLALQASKRALADALITADRSLIGALSVDDLELLLS
jgi:SNF2 family DNA or RNA helicase